MQLPTKTWAGLEIVDVTCARWRAWLAAWLSKQQAELQIVFTPNPEQMVLARRKQWFYWLLGQADIRLPDGQGLVWASKVRQRLTGADSMVTILQLAVESGRRVLVIGGRYTPNAQGKLVLTLPDGKKVPVDYTQGYQNVDLPLQSERQALEKVIARSKPDIVLVAFGAPAQEKWLVQWRDILSANGVRLAMVVGGGIDFLTGARARAPKDWQKWHLEWLFRLIQEPSRFGRQLALPYFVIITLLNGWTHFDT